MADFIMLYFVLKPNLTVFDEEAIIEELQQ
jgi:hypothetical protein